MHADFPGQPKFRHLASRLEFIFIIYRFQNKYKYIIHIFINLSVIRFEVYYDKR